MCYTRIIDRTAIRSQNPMTENRQPRTHDPRLAMTSRDVMAGPGLWVVSHGFSVSAEVAEGPRLDIECVRGRIELAR